MSLQPPTPITNSPQGQSLELRVPSGASDRLDRWLGITLGESLGLSRSRIQTLIEQGQVQLNGQVVTRKNLWVGEGDLLGVSLPEPESLDLQPEPMALAVLYEDDHLLIVNKPKGLVVHPAPGHSQGTLVHGLLAHCPTLPGIGGVQRPGIVHRLDKDTSGALVVAKTEQALIHLQGQIRAKTAQRDYVGIVVGCPKQEQGVISQPIGRHPSHRQKMAIVPVDQGGREAVTRWQLRERFGSYALMQFQLETGRTHQIRVHCEALGHSIVGDPLYGGQSPGFRIPGPPLQGQALHAYGLRLCHPISGEMITAIAPPPEEFVQLLARLRQRG